MSTYPDIKDKNLEKKIGLKFKSLKQPNKPSFKELCYPTEFKLQESQIFPSKFINPSTPYKGVLLLHRIGAGKTCSSIRIAEVWKDKRKIIAIMPASLITNYYKELRSECTGDAYVSNKERKILKTLDPLSSEYKKLINTINERIDKVYDIYSYHKYVEYVNSKKIKLDNAILIIDEVQNIVSETGDFYNTIYESIYNAPKSLRIVLLSATPINNSPSEIALTINLLRPEKLLPIGDEFNKMFIDKNYNMINVQSFKKLIKGYISYFPGAPQFAFPKKIIKIVKCPMSKYQYNSYLATKLQEGDKSFKNILKLPNDFLIGPRIISNICFPNKLTGQEGYDSFSGSLLNINNLKKFSIKFYMILQKINHLVGTAYVYSNFKSFGGLQSFQKVLDYNGYKDFNLYGPGKNRYAIWSSDTSPIQKELAKNVFNQYENKDGKLLKLFLISPSGKEGLSLLRIKQIHILDPYWYMARIEQVIGRGVRYCSHKDIPIDQREVKVYIYLATSEEGECVDEHILKMASRKQKLNDQFYKVIKNSSVDKELY
jgi:hypothetical protein